MKEVRPDGSQEIGGRIQLILPEQTKQQTLEGFYCCFGKAIVNDGSVESVLFAYVEKKEGQAKLIISEIGQQVNPQQKFKIIINFNLQSNDFPIFMAISKQTSQIYMATKMGEAYIFGIKTQQLISQK